MHFYLGAFFDPTGIGDLIRHIEYQSLSDSIFASKTVSIFDCLYSEYSGVLEEFLEKVKSTSRRHIAVGFKFLPDLCNILCGGLHKWLQI